MVFNVAAMPLAQLNATTGPAVGEAGNSGAATPAGNAPAAQAVEVSGAHAAAQQGDAAAATNAANGAHTTTQGVDGSQPGPTTGPARSEGFLGGLIQVLPIILMLGVVYLFLMRGQKKREKQQKQLLSEMKKGDKVMTIGGLVARVVSIDGDDVVLKIDESANVKAVYRKSSIQQVLTPGDDKAK